MKRLMILGCLCGIMISCQKSENLKNDTIITTVKKEEASGSSNTAGEVEPCDDPNEKAKVEITEDSINLLEEEEEGCTLKK